MKDTLVSDPQETPQEEPGFFGAEEVQQTDEIEPEIWAKIDDHLARNPGGHERLIPLLHMVQEEIGYLPYAVQEYIADRLGLSPIQLYGVVSFYHLFTTTPRGRHEVKICMGTACFVRNARRLIEAIEQVLDVKIGEVTEDRLFSLEKVRCLGACSLAPAIMLDSDTHGNLTPKKLRKLVLGLQSEAREESGMEPPEEPGV